MELYARLRTFAEKVDKVRRGLGTAVDGFNEAVGSLERRVLPAARKFRDLGAGAGEEIVALEPVDSVPRLPSAPELTVIINPVAAVTESTM
jgi:DNA recombination protein RmuC